MKSDFIEVTVADGTFNVYAAYPEAETAPVVIVLQEIFGINADMKEACAELAGQGYLALCPDLFWRMEPGLSLSQWTEAEWKKGLELYMAYDIDKGVADIAATIAVARILPGSSGKVGVMGFCLGGLMTFLTAARSAPDAAVEYYGGRTEEFLADAPAIKIPLLMHLAEEDEFMSETARTAIRAALSGNPSVTIHGYAGCSHAFARHNGSHYDAEAARIANGRTADFFAEHLR